MTSNTFNPLLTSRKIEVKISPLQYTSTTPNIHVQAYIIFKRQLSETVGNIYHVYVPINYTNINSICTVISDLIFTIILTVSFSLFFPLMYSQCFFSLHSYLTLSVRQFALLLYLYFFSQCCYNLFSGTVFL